jgi:hypothetical protein
LSGVAANALDHPVGQQDMVADIWVGADGPEPVPEKSAALLQVMQKCTQERLHAVTSPASGAEQPTEDARRLRVSCGGKVVEQVEISLTQRC